MSTDRKENEELGSTQSLHAELKNVDDKTPAFKEKYREARQLFEKEKYRESAKLATSLLQAIMIDIIDRNHMALSRSKQFQDRLDQLLKEGDDPSEIPFRDLCAVFDDPEINMFSLAKKRYQEYSLLLKSFDFENLAELSEYCLAKGDGLPHVKLGVQQILCATAALMLAHDNIEITEYYLLANFAHMTEEIHRIRESYTKLTEVQSKLSYLETEEKEISLREFEWYKQRGMLINKSDGSRNIAFKVETLVSILSTMYKGMTEQLVPKDNLSDRKIDEIAKGIVFESGYLGGSKFGWTMHEIYQREKKQLDLKQKIDKWCAFDFDVGFGMLNLEGDIETKRRNDRGHTFDDLAFKIRLSDNFIVFKLETWQVNLCSFMCGYIQGVLEKITGQPLIVTHGPQQCQQFVAHQSHCTFEVKTDVEKLLSNLDEAQARYNQSVERLFPPNAHIEKDVVVLK
jgi:predicted hydrocarbon binding protein